MIEVECPNCSAKLSVPEQYVGKTGKCKNCGASVTVPAQESVTPPPRLPPDPPTVPETTDVPLPEPPQPEPAAPAPPPTTAPAQPVQPITPGAVPRPQPQPSGHAMDGMIPTKNPSALIAYYCGIFSIIPCVGVVLGPVALIFGIKALKFANQYPESKGRAHALVGIIVGGLVTAAYVVLIVLGIIGGIGGAIEGGAGG